MTINRLKLGLEVNFKYALENFQPIAQVIKSLRAYFELDIWR